MKHKMGIGREAGTHLYKNRRSFYELKMLCMIGMTIKNSLYLSRCTMQQIRLPA